MNSKSLVKEHNSTGENPLYHPKENKLYWVDIPEGKMFRYCLKTAKHEQVYHDRPIGGFTLQQEPDGSAAFLLFRDKGNVVVWQDGKVVRTIIESIDEMADTRFNDCIADKKGRVFAGTMPRKDAGGFLYRIDTDGSYQIVDEPVYTANGMDFTLDSKQMYFTETKAKTIWIFDYDQLSGKLTNKRAFIKTPEDGGSPDGLTTDANGDIYSARYGGGAVYRYDSAGKFKEKIDLPARNITCPSFGGKYYDKLYVTSAVGSGAREDKSEFGGALFELDLAVKGKAQNMAKIQ